MVLDEALEERIAEILRPLLSRWPDLDPEAIRASNRKQAVVPRGRDGARAGRHGARARGAPADGAPDDRRAARPAARAAARCGRAAVADRRVPRGRWRARSSCARRCCGCSGSRSRRSPRRCGVAEDAHGLDGLEITTCLRRGEVEVVTRFEPAAARGLRALRRRPSRARHADTLFSDDGRTVDEQVADAAARARRSTIATAESCTGGLLAGAADRAAPAPRTTCSAGSSSTPTRRRRRWRASTRRSSSASARSRPRSPRRWPTARAARLGADVGVGITGIAGPGRRDRGQAGRPRLLLGRRAGRRAADAQRAPARRARRRARPLDHGRHAPRPPAAWEARRSAPAMSARLFVALELPADVRAGAGGLRARGARESDRALRAVAAGRAAPDARVPRPSRARRGRARARGRARRRGRAGAAR